MNMTHKPETNNLTPNKLTFVLAVALYFIALCISPPVSGQIFDFTFDKVVGQEGSYSFDCGAGGAGGFSCFGPGDDTKFIQGGTISIDGQNYLHQIVIDTSSGFSQETFLLHGKIGVQCGGLSCMTDGSPSQNPTGVAMKQIIDQTSGTETFYDEYLKDQLDNKARTLQHIISGSIDATFSNDVRSQSLTAVPTEAIPVTNQLTITDPDIPTSDIGPGPGLDFDMATDSQNGHSTGSNYFYDELNNRFEYVAF